MAAQKQWIQQLPQILETVKAYTETHFDRNSIEKLFSIKRSGAHKFMSKLGAAEVDRVLILPRRKLLDYLVSLHDEVDMERRRRERLAVTIEEAKKDVKAHSVSFAVSKTVFETTFPGLRESITLGPGKLEIRFDGAQDLLVQLFELGQAITNDYLGFESLVNSKE